MIFGLIASLLIFFGAPALAQTQAQAQTQTQVPANAKTSSSHAYLYAEGSHPKKLLFENERTEESRGDQKLIRSAYTDPNGKEVLREDTELSRGRWSKITFERKDLSEQGSAEVRGSEIWLSHTLKGKTKQDHEKWSADDLPGALLIGQITGPWWDDLVSGEEIPFRAISIDRVDTFGFKVFRVKNREAPGEVAIEMKPRSLFVAALTRPIYLYVDLKTRKITHFSGPTQYLNVDCDGEVVR